MDKVLEMLLLQQELNDATNGEGWEAGLTKNGKVINWKRCIYMECAEMVDSFAWKHWKAINQDPDWANLQIEVVDVWHFIMSLGLEDYSQNFRGNIEDLAIFMSQEPGYLKLQEEGELLFAEPSDIMAKVEELIFNAVNPHTFDSPKLFEDFFELAYMCKLNLADLYRLYVGKNILNQFRQDNGYKEGTYIKVWNGKEDNVVMQELWENNAALTPKVLYGSLQKAYATVS
ncbi:MAG: dUTP diphosphatase [Helicobacteraceae bacterium]|jgi:dimeric dUTPase (all-alpha-NTP-PPase superfamily)|nr:dUTP diphosphatase [Helicobacteraceae bacterium]